MPGHGRHGVGWPCSIHSVFRRFDRLEWPFCSLYMQPPGRSSPLRPPTGGLAAGKPARRARQLVLPLSLILLVVVVVLRRTPAPVEVRSVRATKLNAEGRHLKLPSLPASWASTGECGLLYGSRPANCFALPGAAATRGAASGAASGRASNQLTFASHLVPSTSPSHSPSLLSQLCIQMRQLVDPGTVRQMAQPSLSSTAVRVRLLRARAVTPAAAAGVGAQEEAV